MREQDNMSVHSVSDRMSEPPPPPTPPIPEPTPAPRPQQQPQTIMQETIIQQPQVSAFQQHSIFNNTVTLNHQTEADLDMKAAQQKRRMPPALLTEEQKQLVAEEMNEANLGPICSVCGKGKCLVCIFLSFNLLIKFLKSFQYSKPKML